MRLLSNSVLRLYVATAAAITTTAAFSQEHPPLPPPAAIFSNPPPPPSRSSSSSSSSYSSDGDFHIPSIHESTVAARRILQTSNIATLSSVFPRTAAAAAAANSGHGGGDDGDASILENRPADVDGSAIGLMEYYATCAPARHDPIILGVTIATTMKNAAAGSNVTLSLRYHVPPDAPLPPPDPWAYLPANLPRFALVGRLERLDAEEVEREGIRQCFLEAHPEARIWEPGSDVHDSWWARLVVGEVYFFGGFGDRSRISWLPMDEWRGVTQQEIDDYRLPGEKGYTGPASSLVVQA